MPSRKPESPRTSRRNKTSGQGTAGSGQKNILAAIARGRFGLYHFPPVLELDNPIVDLSPAWPFPPKPVNQLAFQEWLRSAATEIFGCDNLPDWPVFSLDPPNVNALVIHAARCGPFKFFPAWVAWSGTFLGWMRIQPGVEGIDSDYAIGEVLGRQLFIGIFLDISGHTAVDRFQQVLKETAWDLGAADGLTD
jgi:hypothetical protein